MSRDPFQRLEKRDLQFFGESSPGGVFFSEKKYLAAHGFPGLCKGYKLPGLEVNFPHVRDIPKFPMCT